MIVIDILSSSFLQSRAWPEQPGFLDRRRCLFGMLTSPRRLSYPSTNLNLIVRVLPTAIEKRILGLQAKPTLGWLRSRRWQSKLWHTPTSIDV